MARIKARSEGSARTKAALTATIPKGNVVKTDSLSINDYIRRLIFGHFATGYPCG